MILNYNGFEASVKYSYEDQIWFGKFDKIKDLVLFESDSLLTIQKEFEDAVDDYIETKQFIADEY